MNPDLGRFWGVGDKSKIEDQRLVYIDTLMMYQQGQKIPFLSRDEKSSILLRDAMQSSVLVIVNLPVCLSVRLSVCHTRGLCPHGSTYDHDFFTMAAP